MYIQDRTCHVHDPGVTRTCDLPNSGTTPDSIAPLSHTKYYNLKMFQIQLGTIGLRIHIRRCSKQRMIHHDLIIGCLRLQCYICFDLFDQLSYIVAFYFSLVMQMIVMLLSKSAKKPPPNKWPSTWIWHEF